MNTPEHYQTGIDIDLLDVAVALELNAVTFTAIKYIIRAGRKRAEDNPPEKDIAKALDYIYREVPSEKRERIKFMTFDELAISLTNDPLRQQAIILLLHRQFIPYAITPVRMVHLREILSKIAQQYNPVTITSEPTEYHEKI